MKRRFFILSAVIFLSVIFSFGGVLYAGELCTEPVSTSQGLFRGMQDADYEACAWKGIPYAAPPVGELRLAATRPAEPHQGIRDAYEVGPTCIQIEDFTMGGKSEVLSEDCLYLNIWRPARDGKFPVMFWMHGGSFIGGAGSYDVYNGARVSATRDVVIVTINYRLGPLGFTALPELADEDPDGSTGNYGILDQIQALKWVQENIEAFGGDPDNVTIYGQSAGGMSVCTLLVSPPAAGLFHKAISMSGPHHLVFSNEKSVESGRALSEKLGCSGPDVLKCLREKPAGAFAENAENDLAAMGVNYAPCVDGYVLPAKPLELIEQGRYPKVPVIIGSTRDELRSYTLVLPGLGLLTKGSINRLMKRLTGPNYDEVISMYSFSDFRRPVDLAFAFGNQMTFDTPAFRVAEAMAGQNPVYLYRFDWDDTRFPHKMGAFHALDVPFVFNALDMDILLARLLANKKAYKKGEPLAYQVSSYYTNLAWTGDPNSPGPGSDEGLPEWPVYDTETRRRMYLDTPVTVEPLTEMEVKRFRYYAAREYEDVMAGVFKQE